MASPGLRLHHWDALQEPKQVTVKYAAGEQSEEPAKAFVSLNWVMHDEPMSLETELALEFLDALMLGTAAAPLRKALNDSGLGEAIIGGGLQGELCQMGFSLGLKGVDPGNADKASLSSHAHVMYHNSVMHHAKQLVPSVCSSLVAAAVDSFSP